MNETIMIAGIVSIICIGVLILMVWITKRDLKKRFVKQEVEK